MILGQQSNLNTEANTNNQQGTGQAGVGQQPGVGQPLAGQQAPFDFSSLLGLFNQNKIIAFLKIQFICNVY